jgi:glucose-6-phosphate isomerase
MREVRFSLIISAEEMLRYYRGAAKDVIVTTDTGLRVQFPAQHLQRFVTPDGVRGRFAIRFDGNNKFAGIRRL